jgi:hypothetical protein
MINTGRRGSKAPRELEPAQRARSLDSLGLARGRGAQRTLWSHTLVVSWWSGHLMCAHFRTATFGKMAGTRQNTRRSFQTDDPVFKAGKAAKANLFVLASAPANFTVRCEQRRSDALFRNDTKRQEVDLECQLTQSGNPCGCLSESEE